MRKKHVEKRAYTRPTLVEYGSAVNLTQNAKTGTLYESNGNSRIESAERRDSGMHK